MGFVRNVVGMTSAHWLMLSSEYPGFYPFGLQLDCMIRTFSSMDLDLTQSDVFLFAKVPSDEASVLKVDIVAVDPNPAS